MKTILLLSFSLPARGLIGVAKGPATAAGKAPTVASLQSWEGALQGQYVYFYMETQSDHCQLEGAGRTDKYYLVTDGIQTTAYKEHSNWLSRFKDMLRRKYPQATGLGDGLTFSFYFSEEEARAFRQQQIERKRAEGYRIIEVAMPERNTSKAHPEASTIVP